MAFPGASALVVAMCWNWPERRRQLSIDQTMKRRKRQNMPLNKKHQRTNKIIYKWKHRDNIPNLVLHLKKLSRFIINY